MSIERTNSSETDLSWADAAPDASQEEDIRQEAYRLWQEAGEPEGQSEEFWYQAIERLGH